MTHTVPAYVQVAPDQLGSKVRNISVEVLQPNGELATVLMQVVAIADDEGKPWSSPDDWQESMLEQALRTNELLEMILEELS